LPDDRKPSDIRKDLYRPILKVINKTIRSLTNLERDFPLSNIAWLEMNNVFDLHQSNELKRETMRISSKLNDYRRLYWDLQKRITQGFLTYMKRAGYLPSNSPEINSLKNFLPEMLIKGDSRIWIYSYDQYIQKIAIDVGRDPEDAPTGDEAWRYFSSWTSRDIGKLLERANGILPSVYYFRAKLQKAIRDPSLNWDEIKVKRPKVEAVERPIRKFIIIKRPLPVHKKRKRPRKRILKSPKFGVIGPGDDN
jgi:hypothetical protein